MNAIKQSIESDSIFQSSLILLMSCIIHNTKITLDSLLFDDLLGYLVEKVKVNIETISLYTYQRKCIIYALIVLVKHLGHLKQPSKSISRGELFKFVIYYIHFHRIKLNTAKYGRVEEGEISLEADLKISMIECKIFENNQIEMEDISDSKIISFKKII